MSHCPFVVHWSKHAHDRNQQRFGGTLRPAAYERRIRQAAELLSPGERLRLSIGQIYIGCTRTVGGVVVTTVMRRFSEGRPGPAAYEDFELEYCADEYEKTKRMKKRGGRSNWKRKQVRGRGRKLKGDGE